MEPAEQQHVPPPPSSEPPSNTTPRRADLPSPRYPISPLRQSKIITLGDSGVGKSSLVNKMIGTTEFNPKAQPTIGVDFLSQTVVKDGRSLRIQFWDTAGQERYNSLIPGYIRNARVALVVFDVTNPKGLETVDKWVQKVKACKGESTVIIIAGNKMDLEDRRVITTDAAKVKAKALGYTYMDTSAKTGQNVQELLDAVVSSFDNEKGDPLSTGGGGIPDIAGDQEEPIIVVDGENQKSCSLSGCCKLV